jgi:hypothetical protein
MEQEPTTGLERTGTRRSFLRGAAAVAVGAAGVVGAGALAPQAKAAPINPNLAFIARNFHDIRRHENTHVPRLLQILGKQARPRPTFVGLAQPTLTRFVHVSRALENTGVGAYLGALPSLDNTAYITGAGSIALIEARHAGYLNTLLNLRITQNVFLQEQNFERPLTQQEVIALASPFISSLNGGPPLAFDAARSPANDIAILNFALALEFLEQDFYNINVPRFFRL